MSYNVGTSNANYKTGYAISGKRQGFYNSWQNMKQRCTNPNHPKYDRYGGRGISIDNHFLSIESFAEWALANGWQEGLTLDRIDNDGDYSPDNCRWVSLSQNSKKKSTTKLSHEDAVEIRKRISIGENERDIADRYNVNHGTIWYIKNNITHKEGQR